MFSRTPGRIRKLLRKVSGMDASFVGLRAGCRSTRLPRARAEMAGGRGEVPGVRPRVPRGRLRCGGGHRKSAGPDPAGHDQPVPMY
ncbi:hypothetical protein GCM10010503_47530 [Streptomyces lucensis JCM 4490]|uniref:Uncharacterized protein n=1 Tax=Streptomyces lucensis JCM 4490 TaxID=1306176 RepID=A0A918J9Q5_9ACTN|nr:hypothetical protein GCM10010503_47530 [Streptomyces lucensis JCM 4490]